MNARKIIFNLHLYIGLTVGLLLALSGVTGSLLVFGSETDAAINPRLLRVTAPAATGRISVARALNVVETNHAGAALVWLRMPRTAQETFEVSITDANGKTKSVYVHPYTADVLGERDADAGFRGWLHHLHTELFSGETGETIVGIGGLMLIMLSVSGIILWLRNARRDLRRSLTINRRANWKRINYDAHSIVGILAMLLLLSSGVTGSYLVFHHAGETLVNFITRSPALAAAPVSNVAVSNAAESTASISIDDIIERGRRALPASEPTYLILPATPTAPVTLRGKQPSEWHPNGRNFVYFDRYTGAVLGVEDALHAPLGTRILNSLYAIHIGAVGGTPTRILQVVVGLTPAFLFVSGLLMWWNRVGVRQFRRSRHRIVPASTARPSQTEPAVALTLITEIDR